MAESNAGWGELESTEAQALWDTFEPLPDAGQHEALDSFVARKQLTVESLVRLGCRLSAPDVLAIAYPDGIKYRHLVTDRRWSALGTEWRRLKVIPASDGDATTAVVAEGESDAARLTILCPSFDVAVMPAGALRWTAAYTSQLRAYERVLVALDNDARGNAGAAIIGEQLGQAVRWAPPAGKDWCETPADELPPIPEPLPAGLRLVDLGPLIDADLPDPEQIVPGLLYEEGVHWVSGHPGAGKTTLVMHMCQEAMRDGRHVVWLDFESGERRAARRLRDMGVESATATELFHYAPWPARAADHLELIAQTWPGAVVVVDSASKALSFAGLSENENAEVTRWTVQLVRAAKTHKLPVVVIDHVAKHSRDSYARGAGAKLADSDVHWRVATIEKFAVNRIGSLKVTNAKDNDGCLPHELYFSIGDGEHGLPVRQIDAPVASVASSAGEVPAI